LETKILDKLMKDCIQLLKKQKIKSQKRDLINKQKNSFTQEESQTILNEIKELDQQLLELK